MPRVRSRGRGQVVSQGAGRVEDDGELRRVLEAARTIAVVGLSPKASRPSHFVAAYMQGAGYRIVPVNPGHRELLGERCYPSLDAVPPSAEIDIVDVFRSPEHVPGVVESVIARGGPRTLWLQLGCEHPEAEKRALAAGFRVVTGRCLKTEHLRLLG